MKNFNLEIPKFYITSPLFYIKRLLSEQLNYLDVHLTIMLLNETPLSV